jgi:hypothetical protein
MGSAEVKGSPVAVCAVASEGQLPSVCGEREGSSAWRRVRSAVGGREAYEPQAQPAGETSLPQALTPVRAPFLGASSPIARGLGFRSQLEAVGTSTAREIVEYVETAMETALCHATISTYGTYDPAQMLLLPSPLSNAFMQHDAGINKQLSNTRSKLQRWLLNNYRAILLPQTQRGQRTGIATSWQPTRDESNMRKSSGQIQPFFYRCLKDMR